MGDIEKEIFLDRLVEVQDFVILASRYKCDVKVKSKGAVTDGKSILGILSLALWRPVTVSATGKDAEQFARKLSRFQTQ